MSPAMHLADLRNRAAWALRSPRRYLRLRRLRQLAPEDRDARTLKPCLATGSIFLHVPKAAGISVAYSLYGRQTGSHMTLREYRIALGEAEFRTFRRFTFVRNPWDRLWSAWRFLGRGGRNRDDAAWAAAHADALRDFQHFVLHWLTPDLLAERVHFRPQVDFLTLRPGGAIEVDFLGRYEHLAEDYEALRARLGFGAPLEHHNGSPARGPDYRGVYTDAMRERIAALYREDIDRFGYHFEGGGPPEP